MPYIKDDRRVLAISHHKDCGEMNYCFTMLIQSYIRKQGLRYQTINDVIGALEGAKLEFYRRVVAPYEDKKIKENGDVYYVGQKDNPFPDPNACSYVGWDSEGAPVNEHQYDANGYCILCGHYGSTENFRP